MVAMMKDPKKSRPDHQVAIATPRSSRSSEEGSVDEVLSQTSGNLQMVGDADSILEVPQLPTAGTLPGENLSTFLPVVLPWPLESLPFSKA